jgi:hypothetical protein
VGEALAKKEDTDVEALFDKALQSNAHGEEKEQQCIIKDIKRLYIEPDGIMERMRRESVPMEKHEQERKGDVYREVRVGAVFLAERGNERSELAPDVWIDTPKEGSQRYVARRTACGEFDKLLYVLAYQSGLKRAEQVVIIGDGAHWIWDLAASHFPGAVEIVDLYHAQEHVWDVAHAVFGRTTQKGRSWAKHACDLLVHGKIEDLVTEISKLPSIAPPPGKSKSVPEQAVGYFTTNAERMRIPLFVHRACMWAVASPRLLAKPWSLLVSNALACALPLRAWMLSCLCVLPNSIAPLTSSGRRNPGWLLDTYNFFIHTKDTIERMRKIVSMCG